MMEITDGLLVTLIGFFGGIVLGLAARLPRFCTLGAIEDMLYGGSRTRVLMWPVAIAVAIAVTFIGRSYGVADIESAGHLRLDFNPIASILGGLIFGFGMALAGNCGYGALARVGGGDFRALLIVSGIGIASYMISIGPLAPLRLTLFSRIDGVEVSSTGIAHLAGDLTGLDPTTVALIVAAMIFALPMMDSDFRRNPKAILWGAAIGASIALGWIGTTYLRDTGFDPILVETHTFTTPLGESLIYLMTSQFGAAGFSVGSVLGVLVGAFAGSLYLGHFKWEACDDPRELQRQLGGAFLMGFGGVIALGCSVGQGLAAFSTLAMSAPLTLFAIVVGASLGLRFLVEGVGAR
ncbi:MAG: YeeE/YedE family protein [Alphaproteobacteria bacterium]|nr:YeeE/YedE family protein [Alphaproteobacteria bacterium]